MEQPATRLEGKGSAGARSLWKGSAERAEQLQFLRFLAFCLIFLWHADMWRLSFSSGGYGAANAVAFFFVLSGVATGYSRFDREVALTPGAIVGYVVGKIKKAYPLYIFTMLFAVVYSKIPRLVNEGDFPELKSRLLLLLRNALMIQSWFPSDYFSFNGVGWFISTMMFLYILTLPLLSLAWRIKRSRRPALGYCVGVGLLSMAAVAYCYALRNTQMEYTQYVLPVARIWEYGIGICLGCLVRLVRRRFSEFRLSRALLFTVIELATLALWIAAPYDTHFPAWHLRIVHWLLPNGLLLLTFAIGEGFLSALFRARPLVALGNLSFECFLLHQVVLSVYQKCYRIKEPGTVGIVFNLALCMLLTLMASRLIHAAGPGARKS